MDNKRARFTVGQVVKHRVFPFRGVIFDVDPVFSNTDEWYESIPAEVRPPKDQPFYHLLAENAESYYIAYVSEQNLEADSTGGPVGPSADLPALRRPRRTAATAQATATPTRRRRGRGVQFAHVRFGAVWP